MSCLPSDALRRCNQGEPRYTMQVGGPNPAAWSGKSAL